jgi:nitrogen fixation protein
MSNIQSYNALIDRFKAFASGHFILKRFSHGQIEVSDLEKFGEYPFMHVVPSNVTYAKGMKTFSFQIVLADMPRDKEDKTEYQREVLSDLQRIAEDLVAEITNHRVLFGDLITVNNVSLEPFLEEFQHTLTGWTISLDLLVPYYWDACSIPAEWNDMFESSTGGTGSILTFIDSINRDENGNVSLVNDEAEPSPNYYYGTNDEGVRGWYLLTDEVGLTCVTLPTCQTIIDIEAAIDDLQEEILLKANTADISAVGFSNDYNDLDNKPTIPDVSGFVPYTGATTDVDLGTHNLTADHIALNVNPSGAGYVVGATQWNNTLGSSQTLLKGGSVSLKNGVDLVARVVNKVTPNTTLTKAAYQAVRISGAQGGRLAVALAQANNDTNSADTIGIVTETIATNQEGFILTVGQLENINTTGSLQGETWVDGDVLYLSPTTAGRLTNIKPTGATGHIVVVGYVEYAHANNGSIYVKVMNGWELDELHNVYIDTPVNNNVLTYESSTSLWKNKTVATALGYTPVPETRTLTINGTTQDLSANRTFTIATGLTVGTTPITSGTVGRVLFEGTGNVLQQSGSLFWDNTNGRLGVGTASPSQALTIASGSIALTDGFPVRWGTSNLLYGSATGLDIASSAFAVRFRFTVGGNFLIGTTTDAGFKLDVNGTAKVSGATTLAGVVAINSTNVSTGFALLVNGTMRASSITIVEGLTMGENFAISNNGNQTIDIDANNNQTNAVFRVTNNGTANELFRCNEAGNFMIGTNTEIASSKLTVESTTQGFLPPRMTTTQKNAIASPASGLVVYDTTLGKLCVRTASSWETITSI